MSYTLLAGGAGYIGSHVAVELLNGGRAVILADSLCNASADAVAAVRRIVNVNVPFEQIDLCNPSAVNAVFDKYDIDSVIHLASFKGVGESVQLPLKYYRNNLDGLITVLESMAAHKVKKFIFSGSATVYSVTEPIPWTEETPTGNCGCPYGQTKFMMEQILRDVCAADPELCAVTLRYFNPLGTIDYGLRDRTTANLMPYIVEVAEGKRPYLSIFGNDYPTRDGTCVRDYLHVADLAKGHTLALDFTGNAKGFEVFNLGTGKGYSVKEIIAAFERANGVKIPYQFAPRRSGDIAEFYADPAKAKRVLGWFASASLGEMVRTELRKT
jgi:UDP-glucose 4-epimerase